MKNPHIIENAFAIGAFFGALLMLIATLLDSPKIFFPTAYLTVICVEVCYIIARNR